MVRVAQTTTDLQQDSLTLSYEFKMLCDTARRIPDFHIPADQALLNALVESYGMHARNLVLFFFDHEFVRGGWRPAKSTDVIAEDFFPTSPSWTSLAPPLSQLLIDAKRNADKQIAHMTHDRRGLNQQPATATSIWQVGQITTELCRAMLSFLDHVSKGFLAVGVEAALRGRISLWITPPSSVALSHHTPSAPGPGPGNLHGKTSPPD